MKKLLILFFLFIGGAAYAQRQVDHQFNSWWTYVGNHKISEKFSVHTLYSFRRNEFLINWQQSLTRVGLTYKIAPNLAFTLGGDWVITFPYGKQPIDQKTTENRIFGQFVLKNNVNRLIINHRFRVVQQSIHLPNQILKLGRLRYRFELELPITNSTLAPQTLFVSASNEMFVNFGSNVEVPILNQNRAFLGLGYKFNSKSALVLGYMNQYIIKSDDVHIESNNTLSAVVVYNLF